MSGPVRQWRKKEAHTFLPITRRTFETRDLRGGRGGGCKGKGRIERKDEKALKNKVEDEEGLERHASTLPRHAEVPFCEGLFSPGLTMGEDWSFISTPDKHNTTCSLITYNRQRPLSFFFVSDIFKDYGSPRFAEDEKARPHNVRCAQNRPADGRVFGFCGWSIVGSN